VPIFSVLPKGESAAHAYAPPAEFDNAVLACPDTSTKEYFKAMLNGGARSMVFAGRDT